MDYLIEDERKLLFFEKVLEKYGEKDAKKVDVCAEEVIKVMVEQSYKS